MEHRDTRSVLAGSEAGREPPDRLRRERDLRHQHQHARLGLSLPQLRDRLQVHLRLARARDPVQQVDVEAAEARDDRLHRVSLRRLQPLRHVRHRRQLRVEPTGHHLFASLLQQPRLQQLLQRPRRLRPGSVEQFAPLDPSTVRRAEDRLLQSRWLPLRRRSRPLAAPIGAAKPQTRPMLHARRQHRRQRHPDRARVVPRHPIRQLDQVRRQLHRHPQPPAHRLDPRRFHAPRRIRRHRDDKPLHRLVAPPQRHRHSVAHPKVDERGHPARHRVREPLRLRVHPPLHRHLHVEGGIHPASRGRRRVTKKSRGHAGR